MTPLDAVHAAITNQRSWAARSVPLAEAKASAKAAGGTLNDIVLATCSGAMRRCTVALIERAGSAMRAAAARARRLREDARPRGGATAQGAAAQR
jgi:diacylglycerol O-acyltransferase / wax synthase